MVLQFVGEGCERKQDVRSQSSSHGGPHKVACGRQPGLGNGVTTCRASQGTVEKQ